LVCALKWCQSKVGDNDEIKSHLQSVSKLTGNPIIRRVFRSSGGWACADPFDLCVQQREASWSWPIG